MIIYNNRFTKKHVIGGSGITDTLRNILKKAAAYSASKSSLSLMKKMASSELGREAITAAKSAGKELASSAISTGKDVAIDKGKKTIAKVYSIAKPSSSATKTPIPAASDPILIKKSKDILSELISEASVKHNGSSKSGETYSLGSYESMFGGSLAKPAVSVAHSATKKVTKENAIRIQDLVRGRGMTRT